VNLEHVGTRGCCVTKTQSLTFDWENTYRCAALRMQVQGEMRRQRQAYIVHNAPNVIHPPFASRTVWMSTSKYAFRVRDSPVLTLNWRCAVIRWLAIDKKLTVLCQRKFKLIRLSSPGQESGLTRSQALLRSNHGSNTDLYQALGL
jgi:hypothetical protein